MALSELALAEGMDDTRKSVAKHYQNLDLKFLDDEEEDQGKDVPVTEAEGMMDPSTTT